MNTKRLRTVFAALVSLLILPTFTSAETSVSSPASLAGAQSLPVGAAQVDSIHISGDVYELIYRLTTGPGPYHQVAVHRVVRVQNGKPIVSHNALFLVHGDSADFNSSFMGGSHSPESLPVYLATHGIDAWGIDLGWTLVPNHDATDLAFFTFMKDWGLQRDIDDLEKALEFARDIRRRTGSDGGRLTLLGWSRGGEIGYALLNQESQQTGAKRQVKAFIPVDTFQKLNDPNALAIFCSDEAFWKQLNATGDYFQNDGQFDAQLGLLAATDPNGFFFGPPYTNLQTLLVLSAQNYDLPPQFTPYYHFSAGTFPGCPGVGCDVVFPLPTGLAYTPLSRLEDVAIASPPFESSPMLAEASGLLCGDVSLPYDKHLRDIKVPVFYIGAHGGFDTLGLYTLTLLGSEDVSHYIVSLYPRDPAYLAALDYGHGDLFNANNAKDVVWSKILRWLKDHEGDNTASQ